MYERPKRPCTVYGCGKVSSLIRGLCPRHYSRWRRHGDIDAVTVTPAGEPRRYMEEVVLTHEGGGCLIWPYSRISTGYASINVKDPNGVSHTKLVSRIVCGFVHGPAPHADDHAAHSCGNGHLGCVAPKHLRWATPAENREDSRQHGTLSIGAHRPGAKLTEESVRSIRAARGCSQRDLAQQYGVSQSTVSRVVTGDVWSHVSHGKLQ